MWGPVQREAAAEAKAAEAHGPQQQPQASPHPAIAHQTGVRSVGQRQSGGRLHLGGLAAALLGVGAGLASSVVGPAMRGGGRGMGSGGGGGRGRRR
jgi:hypothetical protein